MCRGPRYQGRAKVGSHLKHMPLTNNVHLFDTMYLGIDEYASDLR